MQDWLCMSEHKLTEVLGGTFTKLALFKTATLDTVSYENEHFCCLSKSITNNTININFKDSLSDYVNVQLFTIQGTKSSKSFKVYGNTLTFSPDNTLASGIYILEIEYNNYKFHTKAIVS
jgi:hypothetical protein